MVITNSTSQGKSVVSESVYINYSMRGDGNGVTQEIHGVIYKNEVSVGFLSYDYLRSGFQFTLNPENGFENAEKLQLLNVFLSDIEQVIQTEE